MKNNFAIHFPFEEWRKEYLQEIIRKISIGKGRSLKNEELTEMMSEILGLGMDAMDRVCDTLLSGKQGIFPNGLEKFTLENFLEGKLGSFGEIISEFTLEDFLASCFRPLSFQIDKTDEFEEWTEKEEMELEIDSEAEEE